MKKTQQIAVGLIPVTYIVFMFVWNFAADKYFYSLITDNYSNPSKWLEIIKWILLEIFKIFMIIAPVVYLLTPKPALKNKLYTLIRLVFIMELIFSLPPIILNLINRSFGSDSSVYLSLGLYYLIIIVIGIVLWICKPENEIPRINLSDYEMVQYTSKEHRLVHHIADSLFFYCLSFDWMLVFNGYSSERHPLAATLVSTVNLIIYFFLSEALFRQTLGKAITGSCVVGTSSRLNIGHILGRTFARLIPFDVLSFLWNGNWHDSVSKTTVVYSFSWEDITFDGDEPKETA